MWNAFNYTKENGIALKTTYPRHYSSRKLDCIYRPEWSHFKPANLGMIELDRNVNLVLKRLVQRQPISIAMYASGMLGKYKTGVLTEDYLKCSSKHGEVNHGIVLVGYGKVDQREDRVRGHCREYWIIRNSWGSDWGEEGTFRVCMDGLGSKKTPFGTCLVNKYSTWPNLEGVIIEPTE